MAVSWKKEKFLHITRFKKKIRIRDREIKIKDRDKREREREKGWLKNRDELK